MRDTIIDLFNKAIAFEYSLPKGEQARSSISTINDDIFSNANSSELSSLIYNSIVDLAFEDYKIDISKLDELQTQAFENGIKYDESRPDNESYGFFGEAILNILLRVYYGTDVLIARGNFYSPLDNKEPGGFDSHHFILRDNKVELWCGEAKFYQGYSTAIAKIIANMNRSLSSEFLSKNFFHIIKYKFPCATNNEIAKTFIKQIEADTLSSVKVLLDKYNPKVVYPALVICDKLVRECVIKKSIEKIEEELKEVAFANQINASIFFVFLPVENGSAIKKEVLTWIKNKKPLI